MPTGRTKGTGHHSLECLTWLAAEHVPIAPCHSRKAERFTLGRVLYHPNVNGLGGWAGIEHDLDIALRRDEVAECMHTY